MTDVLTTPTPKRIRVIDIPTDATAEQAEALLSGPYAEGYYLNRIYDWPGVGARAFFNLRVKTEKE